MLYDECRANSKVEDDFQAINQFILSRVILLHTPMQHPPPPHVCDIKGLGKSMKGGSLSVMPNYLILPPFQWAGGGGSLRFFFPETRQLTEEAFQIA